MRSKLAVGTKGFTLVELLVVIAIIALLLAILMPALNKVREQARKIVCANLLKGFGVANQAYGVSYNGNCLPYTITSADYCAQYGGHGYVWCMNLEFRSMMGLTKQKANATGIASDMELPKQFKCPTDKRTVGKGIFSTGSEYINISYGYNHTYVNSYKFPPVTTTPYIYPGFSLMAIKGPSNKVAFMDGIDAGLYQTMAEWRLWWDKIGDFAYVQMNGGMNYNQAAYRHGQGANVNFFDGHTEYRKKGQIFKVDSLKRSDKAANMKMWQPLEDIGLF